MMANYLCLAMDRATHRFRAYTAGIWREVAISFARVTKIKPARVAEELKKYYSMKYFGARASDHNQPYKDMLKRYANSGGSEGERRRVVVD